MSMSRFAPGKLSSKQRNLITRAVEFPLQSFRVAVGDWQSLNGLVTRGLMFEVEDNTFALTDSGRTVAERLKPLRLNQHIREDNF